ncbi:DUF1858 domain-containing protein [Candidatus Woesearchaeota archaeon]|nr:DUF1858 domain-containing protein [Candidatus Woesearchaeota archaeon]
MTIPIKRQSRIGDVISQHPGAAPVMLSYGLRCVGCPVARLETIEQGCRGHGMPEEAIDGLLEQLNSLVQQEGE